MLSKHVHNAIIRLVKIREERRTFRRAMATIYSLLAYNATISGNGMSNLLSTTLRTIAVLAAGDRVVAGPLVVGSKSLQGDC